MRYKFIVKDTVPDGIAGKFPRLSGACYPSGGASLLGT